MMINQVYSRTDQLGYDELSIAKRTLLYLGFPTPVETVGYGS
jgi:hypothetical protein